MDFLWTGQTEFELSPEAPDTGEDRPQQPPQPRDPQANPPAMEPRAWDSAAPYDSAVPYEDHLSDYEPSLPRQEAEPGVLEDRAADALFYQTQEKNHNNNHNLGILVFCAADSALDSCSVGSGQKSITRAQSTCWRGP